MFKHTAAFPSRKKKSLPLEKKATIYLVPSFYLRWQLKYRIRLYSIGKQPFNGVLPFFILSLVVL